jgi:hypothetical protein
MASDRELLAAIKQEFWWFMNEPEQSLWKNYHSLITEHGYVLSKKNFAKLDRMITNIQARRQQAHQAPEAANEFTRLFE